MPTTNNRNRTAFEEHRVVRVVDGDPDASDRVDGSVWYDSSTDTLRCQIDGALHTIDTTVDG